eukprot:TRINITY_DN6861_c0_g1_i1.p1 TRINITY_DN6861_c0_g1~~TRINITY_DN6861_c0_g1_i1.p1  ORF type:complete len:938 (-),score=211.93 TRINITY_DN6861_c0_g1_i1:421-3153(-)
MDPDIEEDKRKQAGSEDLILAQLQKKLADQTLSLEIQTSYNTMVSKLLEAVLTQKIQLEKQLHLAQHELRRYEEKLQNLTNGVPLADADSPQIARQTQKESPFKMSIEEGVPSLVLCARGSDCQNPQAYLPSSVRILPQPQKDTATVWYRQLGIECEEEPKMLFKVAQSPSILPCGHRYCFGCLKFNETGTQCHCGVCQEAFHSGSIITESAISHLCEWYQVRYTDGDQPRSDTRDLDSEMSSAEYGTHSESDQSPGPRFRKQIITSNSSDSETEKLRNMLSPVAQSPRLISSPTEISPKTGDGTPRKRLAFSQTKKSLHQSSEVNEENALGTTWESVLPFTECIADDELKLCSLGAKCGKSDYWKAFFSQTDNEHAMLRSLRKENKYTCPFKWGSHTFNLSILDISGDQIESMTWADGYILMYSISDRSSFDALKKIYETLQASRLSRVPTIVVGLQGEKSGERVVSVSEGQIFSKLCSCDYYEVSSSALEGIRSSMMAILQEIRLAKAQKTRDAILPALTGLGFYFQDPSWNNLSNFPTPPKSDPNIIIPDQLQNNDLLPSATPNWRTETPTHQRAPKVPTILHAEKQTLYYCCYFYGKAHHNYLDGTTDFPIVVSIETFDKEAKKILKNSKYTQLRNFPRGILRTKQFDMLFRIHPTTTSDQILAALTLLFPRVSHASFHKAKISSSSSTSTPMGIPQQLLQFETKQLRSTLKVGLLYIKEGQTQETEYLQNNESSPQLENFLSFLGDHVTLADWKGFMGGLHPQRDGKESICAQWNEFTIMFHVSTMLTHNQDDPQQLAKKRHIGNDSVVIVFTENSQQPFSPANFRSKVTQNYIVVQPLSESESGKDRYKIACAAKEGVPLYPPFLPFPTVFKHGDKFRDFLFTKLVNAERSCQYLPEFEQIITK